MCIRDRYTDWRRHAASHYDKSRYHLLNLHAAFSTERPAHTIEFRAFNGTLHAGEVKSYIQLCLAISHQALTAKAASPARPETDNPKYTFRCWLLRLGFIGCLLYTSRDSSRVFEVSDRDTLHTIASFVV